MPAGAISTTSRRIKLSLHRTLVGFPLLKIETLPAFTCIPIVSLRTAAKLLEILQFGCKTAFSVEVEH